LGGFFISMIVDKNSMIYTKNYKRFLSLLRIRGLEGNIISNSPKNWFILKYGSNYLAIDSVWFYFLFKS
jgi:hypothetical protein